MTAAMQQFWVSACRVYSIIAHKNSAFERHQLAANFVVSPRRDTWGLQRIRVIVQAMHVNRRIFSDESKKKLRRPCREARA